MYIHTSGQIDVHSYARTENKKTIWPRHRTLPLPVSGEVPLSLLIITRRKIDSDLSEHRKRGSQIEWYPEAFSYERKDTFVLPEFIVPQSWPIFLPLEYLSVAR